MLGLPYSPIACHVAANYVYRAVDVDKESHRDHLTITCFTTVVAAADAASRCGAGSRKSPRRRLSLSAAAQLNGMRCHKRSLQKLAYEASGSLDGLRTTELNLDAHGAPLACCGVDGLGGFRGGDCDVLARGRCWEGNLPDGRVPLAEGRQHIGLLDCGDFDFGMMHVKAAAETPLFSMIIGLGSKSRCALHPVFKSLAFRHYLKSMYVGCWMTKHLL